MAQEVICVTVGNNGYSDCRRITELGLDEGYRYIKYITPAQAYLMVKADPYALYVRDYRGNRTYLVAVYDNGTYYVRTQGNDTASDNLLSLQACPV